MVGPSVSAWLMIVLMIVLYRFEGGRHRSFRNAPYPLSDILCGLSYAVGRKAFLLSLPGCFVDDFTDDVRSGVETLRCGGLGESLHRGAGVANQIILNVGAGQRARDQTADQQADARNQQWILFDRLEDRLSRAFGEIGCLVTDRPCSIQPGICGGAGRPLTDGCCVGRNVLARRGGRTGCTDTFVPESG